MRPRLESTARVAITALVCLVCACEGVQLLPTACLAPDTRCVKLDGERVLRMESFVARRPGGWRIRYGEDHIDVDVAVDSAPGASVVPATVLLSWLDDAHVGTWQYDLGRDGTIDYVVRQELDAEGRVTQRVLDRDADGTPEELWQVTAEGGELRRNDGRVLTRVRRQVLGATREVLRVDVGDDGVVDGYLDCDRQEHESRRRVVVSRRPDGGFDEVRWLWNPKGELVESTQKKVGQASATPRCKLDPPCNVDFQVCEAVCAGRSRDQGDARPLELFVPTLEAP